MKDFVEPQRFKYKQGSLYCCDRRKQNCPVNLGMYPVARGNPYNIHCEHGDTNTSQILRHTCFSNVLRLPQKYPYEPPEKADVDRSKDPQQVGERSVEL
jgi:hypothetical protein